MCFIVFCLNKIIVCQNITIDLKKIKINHYEKLKTQLFDN